MEGSLLKASSPKILPPGKALSLFYLSERIQIANGVGKGLK
jgi:hypothetical protein